MVTKPSEARIAAALALAEAIRGHEAAVRRLQNGHGPWDGKHADSDSGRERARVAEALSAYIATAPKLRTRAEVDAERLRNLDSFLSDAMGLNMLCVKDEKLRAEPTTPTDSGPSSDSAPPSALPTGAAYSQLLDRITRLERATEYAPYQGKHQALREIRDELERDDSGPRPIPATKESSDTAGVDAGAANRVTDHDADQREPEACSCDESEALRVKLEEAEAKCLEWQQVTARLQRSEAEMADKLQECRRLLGFVYERAKEIRQALETIP